jgi:hypothetical protein
LFLIIYIGPSKVFFFFGPLPKRFAHHCSSCYTWHLTYGTHLLYTFVLSFINRERYKINPYMCVVAWSTLMWLLLPHWNTHFNFCSNKRCWYATNTAVDTLTAKLNLRSCDGQHTEWSKTVIPTLDSIASLSSHGLANWWGWIRFISHGNNHMCWKATVFSQFISVGRSNKIKKWAMAGLIKEKKFKFVYSNLN